MEQRRALIAVVISVVILVLYQEVVLRRFYPNPRQAGTEAPAIPAAEQPEPAPEAVEVAPAAAPAVAAAAAARHIIVDTSLYTATFSTLGARLTSFQLKKYRTTVQPDSPLQETILAGQAGEFPLGVELRGPQGAALSDANAAYTVDKDSLTLASGEEGSLQFLWVSAAGTVRKQFTFRGDSYGFAGTIGLRDVPASYNELSVSWSKAVDAPPEPGGEVVFDRAAHLEGKKLIEDLFNKLADGKIVSGDIRWAGYSGRHFFAAFAPTDPHNPRLWLKVRDRTVEQKLLLPITPPAADVPVELYIGPKDFDSLETLGHDFARAVDLGWFWFIALPLLHVLQFSHRFTGNYGFDIILLTVVIKILFIPLTQTSYKSMKAMQKLQPQMTKIREKFKDNSEQMNKEIMELYRRHKVNPFGGCLPMVLQIPVFIGLYSALTYTVALRHAPFMLWINDLAAPDRLGTLQLPFVQHPGIPVMTLFMGASMFLQQWMTPSVGDPSQRQMMMIMPLMFTFMFVNYPSGLSLYWLVNNVLTIAQQYYMNRTAT